jgi:MYXO-CTERM domain-containing protein
VRFRHLILPVCVQLAGPAANANLTHFYTFNDGTANDSVGGANGVLMNGAAVSGGQLVFSPSVNNGANNPSTGQYVSLPYDVARTPSFTLEFWATDRSSTPWQRLIDMNNGTSSYKMVATNSTPTASQGPIGQVTVGGTDYVPTLYNTIHPSLNAEHQYVYTFDGTNDRNSIYIDGVLCGQNPAGASSPANTYFTNFWLGRSAFAADPYLDGTIDQFSVYDTALSSSQVAGDFNTGPVPVPEPAAIALLAVGLPLAARRRRP